MKVPLIIERQIQCYSCTVTNQRNTRKRVACTAFDLRAASRLLVDMRPFLRSNRVVWIETVVWITPTANFRASDSAKSSVRILVRSIRRLQTPKGIFPTWHVYAATIAISAVRCIAVDERELSSAVRDWRKSERVKILSDRRKRERQEQQGKGRFSQFVSSVLILNGLSKPHLEHFMRAYGDSKSTTAFAVRRFAQC